VATKPLQQSTKNTPSTWTISRTRCDVLEKN